MKESAILKILKIYKDHLRQYGLAGEVYKWELLAQFRGRPNLYARNFYEELKGINFSNLVYEAGVRVMHHLAQARSEAYRDCLKNLFDEAIPLLERIRYFNEETLKIYRELEPDKRLSHHQDERTMAIFLTYHKPDKYTLYKDSFYQSYCRLIGIQARKKNKKYVHYLELVDDFIERYIKTDDELIHLFQQSLPEHVFQDENFNILAQDILYQTLERQLGAKRSYWRIGTRINDQSVWEDMQAKKMACIGWSELGDLREENINSKKDINACLAAKGFYTNQKSMRSRKAGEIFDFYTNLKEGDVVVAQDGHSILGLGIITDEYQFEEQDIGAHQMPVDWRVFNLEIKNTKGSRTTVYKLTDYNLVDAIDQLLETSVSSLSTLQNMNTPLNQIFFGPPGTGKTYHTVNEALRICGVDIAGLSRTEIKAAFDQKMRAGQIVFTTFHQSMSYEEFIEGIKPIEPERDGGEVVYRVEPGLFKQLSTEAAFDFARLSKSKETTEALNFSDLYDVFVEEAQERLLNEEKVELSTRSGGTVWIDSISQQGNVIIKHHNGVTTYTVSKSRLTKLNSAFNDLAAVSNIHNEFREVIGGSNASAYWSVLNAMRQTAKSSGPKKEEKFYSHSDQLEIVKKMTPEDFSTAGGKNYVLIIDEINRGNISQIFGELITLIEEDKRLGKAEALELMLPYSKEKFGVPPNLYIIGTMNTADRSVEALDTALRRRFSFQEMPPRPELLEPTLMLQRLWLQYKSLGWGDAQWIRIEQDFMDLLGATILNRPKYEALEGGELLAIPPEKFADAIQFSGLNLRELLATINRRIEVLLDRDHLIGHSYFLGVHSWEGLQTSFYRHLIPLLQEYFYGDYAKMGAVLGRGFVAAEEEADQVVFAAGYEGEDFLEKTVYQIIDYRRNQVGSPFVPDNMSFQKAIRLLMNQEIE